MRSVKHATPVTGIAVPFDNESVVIEFSYYVGAQLIRRRRDRLIAGPMKREK